MEGWSETRTHSNSLDFQVEKENICLFFFQLRSCDGIYSFKAGLLGCVLVLAAPDFGVLSIHFAVTSLKEGECYITFLSSIGIIDGSRLSFLDCLVVVIN